MKCLDLFAGIGGFGLAAQWMCWETVAWCEINPFCQTVLRHHFPDAAGHSDIKTTDFTQYAGTIDILIGGFPCQPYSTAGLRKGKDDERHLWPEMLRAIREVQPRWVVGENVRGLISWNGGMVFDEVQVDLEAAGYEILPFLLPACGVDAPHRRDRVWFIAYCAEVGKNALYRPQPTPDSHEYNGLCVCGYEGSQGRVAPEYTWPTDNGGDGITTHTNKQRSQRRSQSKEGKVAAFRSDWSEFPAQSPVCAGNDGIPTGLAEHSLSKSGWLTQAIMGAGNAIVPQVVLQIFRAIEMYEKIKNTHI